MPRPSGQNTSNRVQRRTKSDESDAEGRASGRVPGRVDPEGHALGNSRGGDTQPMEVCASGACGCSGPTSRSAGAAMMVVMMAMKKTYSSCVEVIGAFAGRGRSG